MVFITILKTTFFVWPALERSKGLGKLNRIWLESENANLSVPPFCETIFQLWANELGVIYSSPGTFYNDEISGAGEG